MKSNQEIRIAADEMLQKFGERAAMEAANWSRDAFDQGDMAKYEFWQWVYMNINERDFQGMKQAVN